MSDESKSIYDKIMKKSYTTIFNQLSNDELEELTKLHAFKVKEIMQTKDKANLSEDDVKYMALYTKLSNRYKKVFNEKIDLNADNKVEVSKETIDKLNDKPKVSRR